MAGVPLPTSQPRPSGAKPDTESAKSSSFNRRAGKSSSQRPNSNYETGGRRTAHNTGNDAMAGKDMKNVATGSNIKRR